MKKGRALETSRFRPARERFAEKNKTISTCEAEIHIETEDVPDV